MQINFKINTMWRKQKRTRSEMHVEMTVKMYSSFTWGPTHIGGVEGTSGSGMESGGWNNRTIQTSSITTETRVVAALLSGKESQSTVVLLSIFNDQSIATCGNWMLTTIARSTLTQIQITPKWTDIGRPVGDKKGKYSNGGKCRKYKHENKTKTNTCNKKKTTMVTNNNLISFTLSTQWELLFQFYRCGFLCPSVHI